MGDFVRSTTEFYNAVEQRGFRRVKKKHSMWVLGLRLLESDFSDAKSPNAEGEFFQSGKAFPAFCLEKIQPEKAVIVFFCLDPVEMVKIDLWKSRPQGKIPAPCSWHGTGCCGSWDLKCMCWMMKRRLKKFK